jgi:cellulose synthase/poly-beta-1,6-N-acetylglucosamine synthase-like glycosyltransferase
MHEVHRIVLNGTWLLTGYFVALNLIYALMSVLGFREIRDYVRRSPMRDYRAVARSPLAPPISLLVPAYNEQACIVQSVHSLLRTSYATLEVVIVNDGSKDETLAELIREFQLVPVERVPRARLVTKPIRGVYVSRLDPRITAIDKENGGKADSLNAALCYARYPLVCSMDSDTMLERDALARLVWPFQTHPETIAIGGIVRIANGCAIENGEVTDVRTPRSIIGRLQTVEYLRAFLSGRTAWSRLGMLLVISGAFGLFRREAVIEAGGYATDTVGEDAELVVRLHRLFRDKKVPYRIGFLADPVCWTESPSSWRVLARQRDRWQRGLIETLWRHRTMLFNPRYGRVGLVAMPYYLVFELLGPVLETAAMVFFVAALALGIAPPSLILTFIALSCVFGLCLSTASLVIEEHAFRRYRRWTCLLRLMSVSLVENFGYRQWQTLIRLRAFTTLRRNKHSWGAMTRTGFSDGATPSSPPAVTPRPAES